MPRPPTSPRRSGRWLAMILVPVLAFLLPDLPMPCTDDEIDETIRDELGEEGVDDVETYLDALWGGTLTERLEAAEEAFFWVPTELEDTCGEPYVVAVIESLTALLDAEEDEWVLFTMLLELADETTPLLHPLFRAALQHGSPNLRWTALRWLEFEVDPETVPLLERAWTRPGHRYARALLLHALANHESRAFLDDVPRLLRGEDEILAVAAVEALSRLGDGASLRLLAPVVRAGTAKTQATLAAGLGVWGSPESAIPLLADLARSPEPGVRHSAVSAMALHPVPEGDDLLIAIGARDPIPAVRTQAIHALEGSEHGDLAPLLLSTLLDESGRTSLGEALAARRTALKLLERADWPEIRAALAEESSDWSRREFASGLEERIEVPPARPLRAPPPDGLTTIRCWPAPGRAGGDYAGTHRIVAGAVVEVDEVFQIDNELWVDGGDGCWLPLSTLEEGTDADEAPSTHKAPQADGATEILWREFDLSWEDLLAPPALALREAGLLEVLDPCDTAAAALIRVDPRDRAAVMTLLHAAAAEELAGHLAGLVAALPDSYASDPEIGIVLDALLSGD